VIADIDDTLVCSGGSEYFKGTWAGVDRRLPPSSIYPGIMQLFLELDLGLGKGSATGGEWTDDRIGSLVFLSARARTLSDWTERSNFAMFERLIQDHSLHTRPTLLTGDLGSVRAVWNDMVPMAMKKVLNFQQYVSLYPEFDYVFIGDNGQADVYVAEMISEWCRSHKSQLGRECRLRGCFIHQVQPKALTYRGPHTKYQGHRTEDHWQRLGIHFFRTYVGAATTAHQLGLLDVWGLHRVATRALSDLDHVAFVTDVQREAMAAELNEDLRLANGAFRESQHNVPQIAGIAKGELYAL